MSQKLHFLIAKWNQILHCPNVVKTFAPSGGWRMDVFFYMKKLDFASGPGQYFDESTEFTALESSTWEWDSRCALVWRARRRRKTKTQDATAAGSQGTGPGSGSLIKPRRARARSPTSTWVGDHLLPTATATVDSYSPEPEKKTQVSTVRNTCARAPSQIPATGLYKINHSKKSWSGASPGHR